MDVLKIFFAAYFDIALEHQIFVQNRKSIVHWAMQGEHFLRIKRPPSLIEI